MDWSAAIAVLSCSRIGSIWGGGGAAANVTMVGPAYTFRPPPLSIPPPGSPVPAYPLPQHVHELRLILHFRAVLETPVRASLPARQTLPRLAALLDDVGRRSVGHMGGHDIEKGQVVRRLVGGLQLRFECHALDGRLQRQQAGCLGLPPQK